MTADSLTHEDLVILTAFLAEQGHDARSVAYAVEKPWKYAGELALAKAISDHEHATNHDCYADCDVTGPWVWRCAGLSDGKTTCDWTFEVPDAG